jgi:alpha-D-xyloside xylohydrolase
MKNTLKSLLLTASLLISGLVYAQVSPGSVNGVEEQKDGVLFRMRAGAMKLQILDPAVIHVVYSPDGTFPQHENPMLVPVTLPAATWKSESSEKEITLRTAQVTAVVARKDGAITFKDQQDNALLREGGDDGGKLMVAATVNGEKTYHATDLFLPTSGEAFYGLGQHQSGEWNYAGEAVTLAQGNTNISIPFFVSSKGYGVFWNNASVSRFNNSFPARLYLTAEVADTIDYFFIYGPQFDRIIAQYRALTGQAPLFGKWAYGFWQCKNRYKSQEEVLGIARKYRELGIPIDDIVQDWFWWTKMGSHIFNENYPDPQAMTEALHREHFHIMISVWPTFLPGTANLDTFKHNGWFIHYNSDSASWLPGAGLYDAFNPKARDTYWKMMNDSLFARGFDAWWLDTTEPETLYREDNMLLEAHTGMGSGARYANLYPLMTTKGVYDGQRAASQDKRVFILTRSAAPGMQRNAAAAWSGDIYSTWTSLKRQIPAGLNYMLSGLPYWTTDIGGFVSGEPTDPAYRELFVRWFEYGSFCPIFRVHGTRKPDQNELWSYGAQAQAILTKYDTLRYRLMPYIYSLAWRVTHDGYTFMRPLVMDFRTDEQAGGIGDQFMFGPALLANPVTDLGATTRRLYLPKGTWYDFWTGQSLEGGRFVTAAAPLETMPLYVRAGSMLPLGPTVQYASEKPADPLELRIYRGGDADFTLYEDDGETYGYEKGAYATIPMHWSDSAKTLTIGDRSGSFPGMLQHRTFQVVCVSEGYGTGVGTTEPAGQTLPYDGKSVTVTLE